ncbi:L,D-transpeptidase family protein [Miniphocaeibacter halophilus]|uniref:Peptidoglycan binding domain-containing protein n=1 Tax=Miniphocaeibacter halophilus TaxID=2931922 RepID=A0AC61MTS7_9FIRM|nr:L,D-transpeptidase family protein [Miniphocaeibacter halophilus]QQK07668.1 peptidoglycan binding domain-containing protein [Miniphocaeibacter halophilus]
MTEEVKKKSVFKKIFIAILILLVLVYLAGIYVFSKYTYPNTYLNEVKIPFKQIDTLFTNVDLDDILIYDKDNEKYVLNPTELNFVADYKDEIEVKQNSFLWPFEIFSKHEYINPVEKSVNADNLKSWINESELTKNMVEPVNAEIVKENNNYIIKEEVVGNTLDKDKLYTTIENSYLNSVNEITLKDEYIKPTVVKKDLEERAEFLNKLIGRNLSIKIHDDSLIKLDDMEIFINENEAKLDYEKVKNYVTELKNKYDNLNKERKFTTFAGNEVSVPGGNYGIQINLEKSTDAIFNALSEGDSEVVDLVYTHKSPNNGEIGNTYVEISIADQRMIFYKDGNVIVDTPVVTGQPNGKYDTPRGVWNVWIKERDRYLQGYNSDGTKYKSWVQYWLQIDYTGVGIHDAYWQNGNFGGQRYKTNAGSHGCINTPLSAVSTLYNNIEKGTPVIIY